MSIKSEIRLIEQTLLPVKNGNFNNDGISDWTGTTSEAVYGSFFTHSKISNSVRSKNNFSKASKGETSKKGVTYTLSIGDDAFGGKIAYIYQPGDTGYVEGEQRGLVAQPLDIGYYKKWGCGGVKLPGIFGQGLGTGLQNTLNIVNNCSDLDIAARLCYDSNYGGYNDWFLPSVEELYKIILNKDLIGGFYNEGVYYFSSTQNTATVVYAIIDGEYNNNANKDSQLSVRAIRYFDSNDNYSLNDRTLFQSIPYEYDYNYISSEPFPDCKAIRIDYKVFNIINTGDTQYTFYLENLELPFYIGESGTTRVENGDYYDIFYIGETPITTTTTTTITGTTTTTTTIIITGTTTTTTTIIQDEEFLELGSGGFSQLNVSTDGDLIGVGGDGGIYITYDYGVNWVHRGFNALTSLAINDDGSKIYAGQYVHGVVEDLKLSNNGGITWLTCNTRSDSGGSRAYGYAQYTRTTTDGLKCVFIMNNYRHSLQEHYTAYKIIFYTDDGGVTWKRVSYAFFERVQDIGLTKNGDFFSVATNGPSAIMTYKYTTSYIALSAPNITILTEVVTPFWENFKVGMSDNVEYLYLTNGGLNKNKNIFNSLDSGHTWSDIDYFDYKYIVDIKSSPSGQYVVCISSWNSIESNRIFYSKDYGVNWVEYIVNNTNFSFFSEISVLDNGKCYIISHGYPGILILNLYIHNITTTTTTLPPTTTTTTTIIPVGTYSAGDEALGGIIAYIYQPGDPGYIEGRQNGFVISGRVSSIVNKVYGCSGTLVGTSFGLGKGLQNTLDIISACDSPLIAAYHAYNFEQSGYTDWFLPSRDELLKVYDNRNLIGISQVYYTNPSHVIMYSSSETSSTNFNALSFLTDSYNLQSSNKGTIWLPNKSYVFPIRYF